VVQLTVSDNGTGMDERTRENIFEPFFTTKGKKGTGLGLATVYGIVQQNRGYIEVSSETGKGSTFRICLPRVEGVEAPALTPATKPAATAPHRGSETILVVEDQDEVRDFVVKALASCGYHVLQAGDGAQALALAERHALATSFSNSDFVVAGGLMSYGPDQVDSYREAGKYTGRILKGEKPAGLPVLVSTKFDFALNLKTAKSLGLTVPPTMLALATAVIE